MIWSLDNFEVSGVIESKSDGEAETEFSSLVSLTPLHEFLINTGWTMTSCESKFMGSLVGKPGYNEYKVTINYI